MGKKFIWRNNNWSLLKSREESRNPDPRDTKRHQQHHARRSTPRRKVIKMAKITDKDRIFKAAKEKEIVT